MPTPAPRPGKFAWREPMTPDAAVAKDYCTRLFGWTTREMDMGEGPPCVLFRLGEENVAGMMPFDPAQWLSYVAVDDVDAMVARVPELGGKVFLAPSDVPDVGRLSVTSDPQGATLALSKAASA